MSSKDRPRLDAGAVFGGFTIKGFVGHGSFGDIYSCEERSDQSIWAIKLELKTLKTNLEKEAEFLRAIQGSKYFPVYRDYGETDEFRFLVMELLGPSLLGARRISRGSVFSTSTALRLGIEMLKCIQEFHRLGYLHRDIKPGNFLLRPSRSHPLILIDFGLSRAYLDKNGEKMEPREHPGFVGTVPYASINAHNGLELGRCDDLFSWFSVLMKIHVGELPWPNVNDKPVVFAAKKDVDMASFCVGLPSQYITIYRIIIAMKREDTPNYDLLYQLLAQAMEETHSSFLDPFDWEASSKDVISSSTSICLDMPKDEEPDIPKSLSPELKAKLMIRQESSSYESSSQTAEIEVVEGCCGCRI